MSDPVDFGGANERSDGLFDYTDEAKIEQRVVLVHDKEARNGESVYATGYTDNETRDALKDARARGHQNCRIVLANGAWQRGIGQ